MRKILAVIFVILILASLCACGDDKEFPDTTGGNLASTFVENADKSVEEIGDAIVNDPAFGDHSYSMVEVEEGSLLGFDGAEIKGFDEGVLIKHNSGFSSFLGYVFEVSKDTDIEDFKQNLKDNANPNWNGIENADEVIVESEGDKVIVIITPNEGSSTDAVIEPTDENGNPVEDEMPIQGDNGIDVNEEEFEEF